MSVDQSVTFEGSGHEVDKLMVSVTVNWKSSDSIWTVILAMIRQLFGAAADDGSDGQKKMASGERPSIVRPAIGNFWPSTAMIQMMTSKYLMFDGCPSCLKVLIVAVVAVEGTDCDDDQQTMNFADSSSATPKVAFLVH